MSIESIFWSPNRLQKTHQAPAEDKHSENPPWVSGYLAPNERPKQHPHCISSSPKFKKSQHCVQYRRHDSFILPHVPPKSPEKNASLTSKTLPVRFDQGLQDLLLFQRLSHTNSRFPTIPFRSSNELCLKSGGNASSRAGSGMIIPSMKEYTSEISKRSVKL